MMIKLTSVYSEHIDNIRKKLKTDRSSDVKTDNTKKTKQIEQENEEEGDHSDDEYKEKLKKV